MNIAILSRDPKLYSTRRLKEAGEKRGHKVEIIDHMKTVHPEVWAAYERKMRSLETGFTK